MKIRTGFVSNSSSSSFVILGKAIGFDEITKNNLESVYAESDNEYGEGYPVFELTKEMYKYLKQHPEHCYDLKFYEVYDYFDEESAKDTLDKSKLPESCQVYFFCRSQNSPHDLQDFIELFEENND